MGALLHWWRCATPRRRNYLLTGALAFGAAVLYTLGRAPFLGQWDSFDYVKQIVTHRLSDLAFGRPVFIGVNVIVWEAARRLFRLEPLAVGQVALAVVIVSGVAGVLLFRRLARNVLSPHAARLAVAAFLLSPVYAVYAGSVMTEVPMLVLVLASAVLLWEGDENPRALRLIGAGLLFGASIGIREQALFLGPALAWILLVRIPAGAVRSRALLFFGVASFAATTAPILWLYLDDPVGFAVRTRVWLSAIPTGETHFWRNVQATAIYTFLLAPAAWAAVPAAFTRRSRPDRGTAEAIQIPHPVLAVISCLMIPVAILWRDADVQIHPRYLLPALPAVAILCAAVCARRLSTLRGTLAWCLLHVLFFSAAQIVMQPLRSMQREKRHYAQRVVESVKGEALLIAGAYSPVFDYYRAVGIRPGWRIVWSGWGWDSREVESRIENAKASRLPVYVCDGPWAWLYFEEQRLDLRFIPSLNASEAVFPGLNLVRKAP